MTKPGWPGSSPTFPIRADFRVPPCEPHMVYSFPGLPAGFAFRQETKATEMALVEAIPDARRGSAKRGIVR